MSNWIGHTNHKLYQARLLLDQVAAAKPNALAEALDVAALYHLRDAYLCYLHELAELVQFHHQVDALSQLMADAPLKTGEMQELATLERDGFSWLAALLAASKESLQSQPSTRPQPDGSQLIALQSQNQSEVWQWYQQLAELIERQREHRQES